MAEVLITLGIIGVVAAITLPTLITNIQDKHLIAKWKREYSLINNAFQMVVNEGTPVCENYHANGSCIDAVGSGGYRYFSEEFIQTIMKKLKYVDYCSGLSAYQPNCDNSIAASYSKYKIKYKWSGINNIYSRYKALGAKNVNTTYNGNEYGIASYNFMHWAYLLNDGAAVYFGGLWGGPWIVIDVNNFNQGPNEIGRDVFIIKVFSNINTNQHILKPAGAKDTPSSDNPESGSYGCSKDIGLDATGNIDQAAGAGCSAKYLTE